MPTERPQAAGTSRTTGAAGGGRDTGVPHAPSAARPSRPADPDPAGAPGRGASLPARGTGVQASGDGTHARGFRAGAGGTGAPGQGQQGGSSWSTRVPGGASEAEPATAWDAAGVQATADHRQGVFPQSGGGSVPEGAATPFSDAATDGDRVRHRANVPQQPGGHDRATAPTASRPPVDAPTNDASPFPPGPNAQEPTAPGQRSRTPGGAPGLGRGAGGEPPRGQFPGMSGGTPGREHVATPAPARDTAAANGGGHLRAGTSGPEQTALGHRTPGNAAPGHGDSHRTGTNVPGQAGPGHTATAETADGGPWPTGGAPADDGERRRPGTGLPGQARDGRHPGAVHGASRTAGTPATNAGEHLRPGRRDDSGHGSPVQNNTRTSDDPAHPSAFGAAPEEPGHGGAGQRAEGGRGAGAAGAGTARLTRTVDGPRTAGLSVPAGQAMTPHVPQQPATEHRDTAPGAPDPAGAARPSWASGSARLQDPRNAPAGAPDDERGAGPAHPRTPSPTETHRRSTAPGTAGPADAADSAGPARPATYGADGRQPVLSARVNPLPEGDDTPRSTPVGRQGIESRTPASPSEETPSGTAADRPARSADTSTATGTGRLRGNRRDREHVSAPSPDATPDADGTPAAAGCTPSDHHGPATPDESTPPDTAPAPPSGKRPRNRGIAAWARRLTGGGRGDRQPQPAEADARPAATGSGVREERGTAGTSAALRERWPDPAAVLLTALGPGPRLWERGPDHADLLTVRLGTADRYSPAADGGTLLPAVPVTVGLRQAGSLGLAGPRARLAGLARSVLAHLAALHSPSVLEYVLIAADPARPAEERQAEWAWFGWLPHLRPTHGQDCRLLVAYDREQAAARTAELVRRLDDGPLGPGWPTAPPEEVAAAAGRHPGPYTVVVVDGDPGTPALRETVARLAARGAAAGIHLVCLAEAPSTTASSPVSAALATAGAASPAFPHCGAVALLSGDVATVVQVIERAAAGGGAAPPPPGSTVVAAVDAVSGAWAERFARALAPLRVADAADGTGRSARVAALPRTARLLDELGLARATPASLTARWASATDPGSRPGGRAVAVLGAGPHGPLTVDLATDGPHLLVEGGPGSGRTELLRSLAASLAADDRPDRLSLVLVDGAAAERGEGLRVCTDLPHVSTYLAASDPVRMREFAQALGAELKRRAELLGTLGFTAWHERHAPPPAQAVPPRRSADPSSGELDSPPTGTLRLRAPRHDGPSRTAETALPRLVVLVDDYDALVAPALGSTGRPAAGSVVRALEAVARDGDRLGVHLVAASGRPDRTDGTEAAERATLRVQLEIAPGEAGAPGDGGANGPAPGRGRLHRAGDEAATPFQAGRVTGRIPRTATLRPTVVPLDWQRMGDPPARRPVRELGNGPTDLALLASALQRAAQSAGAQPAPPLL